MLRRAGWALTCAILTVFFQSFLRQPVAPWLVAGLGALAVLSALRPFAGLVAITVLGPLASVIYALGRGDGGNAVFAEGITLAFVTGWTARQSVTGEILRVPASVRWPAVLLALLAAASGIVHGFGVRAEAPFETLRTVLDWYVLRDYPLRTPGIDPIAAAVVLFTSTWLVLAAAHLCAGDPHRRTVALAGMVCGATAAAAFSVRRLVEIASRAEHPWTALVEHAWRTRISVHIADKNAAGSAFALSLLLAVGLVARQRWLALGAALVTGAALWLTGSRVALVAAFVGLVVVAFSKVRSGGSRQTRRIAWLALAAVICGGAAVYTWYPEGRNLAASQAFEVRAGLIRAGLQMWKDHPVFGIGLGRFSRLSPDYVGETLAKFGFARENAHNNLVQLLAELGLPGLVAFAALVAGALVAAWRSERPRPLHVTALAAAIVSYLITTLAGHPFLVPAAAYPFWIAVGCAASPMAPVGVAGLRARVAIAVVAIAILVAIPWRAQQAVLHANLEHVSEGFSKWQGTGEEWRYRFMGGRAAFYVPAGASAVQLQLRVGVILRRTVEVTALVEGREVNRILLPPDDQWRTLRFVLRKPSEERAFLRVDLVAREPGQEPLAGQPTDDAGIIVVRRPYLEGLR